MKGLTRAFLIVAVGYCVQGGLQASEKDNSIPEKHMRKIEAIVNSSEVQNRKEEVVNRHNHQAQTEFDLSYGLWKDDYEFGYVKFNTESDTDYLRIFIKYRYASLFGAELYYTAQFFFEQNDTSYVEIELEKEKKYDWDYTVIDAVPDFFECDLSDTVSLPFFGKPYNLTIDKFTSGEYSIKKVNVKNPSKWFVVEDIYLIQQEVNGYSITVAGLLYCDLPPVLDWFFPEEIHLK